jgi:L-rhamnose-H+ transport protein
MHVSIVAGFLLILLAALMNGAYAIPMKFMRSWRWENIWLIWTVLSLWIFPVVLAWAAVPQPLEAYRDASWYVLLRMGLMGLLWGSGVLLLGMSFPLVGVAVGAAVGLGCAAAMGTILPVLYSNSNGLSGNTRTLIAVGVVIVVVGVAICGVAGRMRERHQQTGIQLSRPSIRGFLFASIGGSLTAALNLALAVGASINSAVTRQHPSSSAASIAVWIPVLLAGGLPGVVYTVVLLNKNRSVGRYLRQDCVAYWPLIAVMGVLWLGSIVVYGNGVLRSGPLGLVIGWPVFMSGAVIASAGWGTIFGEWRNAGRRARTLMMAGVFFLTLAIAILGKAGR